VLDVPEGAKVIASNDFCQNAALVYDDRALTIQPHPEFGSEIIAQYVSLRRGTETYPDVLMDRAAASTADTDSNSVLASKLAGFFLQNRDAHSV
jgi:GMP synthase-like glutamine amidotransferase